MFAVGHPTALASPAVRGDAPVVALERDARAETTALVTSSSLEIWRGSRRLGGFWRSPATVADEGAFLAAKWRDGRNTLAVVAEGGRVYLYHLAFHDGPETVAGVASASLAISRRATLRLATPRVSVRPPERAVVRRVLGASSANGVPPLSPVIEDAAAANDGACVSVAGDRDVLLVGTSTGHLVQFDWDRRGGLGGGRDGDSNAGDERPERGKGGKGAGVLSRGDQLAHAGEVSDADFCGGAGVLVAVAGPRGGDGAAAVLRLDDHALVRATAAAAGVPPRVAERLSSPRWCPGSEGATCARLAPHAGVAAGLVAVGTRRGECLLYRLPEERGAPREWTPGAQPVFLRALRLRDWGVSPGRFGSVADARWSPDGAAIAVGHARAGLAVWSPGGCRLICTLDLGASVEDDAGKPHAAATEEEGREEPRTALGVERVAWTGGGWRIFATAPARARERRIEGESKAARAPSASRAHARALQYALATPAPARAADLGDGESAASRVLTCADGFLVLAGEANEDANEDAASGNENDGNGGPPRRARPRARRVALPDEYVRTHGPPRLVCAREGGADVLAAGARGFVLVDLETEKARVFGDVSQEKAFVAVAAAWVGDVVAVVVKAAPRGGARGTRERRGNASWFDWFGRSGDDDDDVDGDGDDDDDDDAFDRDREQDPPTYSLRVYPKYHLDASSALLDAPLPAAPLAVNAHGPFLLVALAAGPARVRVPPGARGVGAGCTESAVLYEVIVTGAPRLGGGARAALRETRRAALGSVGKDVDTKVLDVAPVPSTSTETMRIEKLSADDVHSGGPELALVWRAGGALALVDMRGGVRNGRVTRLAREGIERFWVAGAPRSPATPSDTRWSFWTYGAEGTRAWHVPFSDALPSWLAPAHGAEDPELELDRESYPLCVRLGARGVPAVAGCAQRLLRRRLRDAELSAPFFRTRFAPAPTSQPVLPCALRHLLRRGEWDAALAAARASAGKPGFTHALEWLLFSALDRAAGPGNAPRGENDPERKLGEEADPGGSDPGGHRAALADAARLIREFPEFTDVVASVARKTDAVQWPALFAVAGDPEALQARAAAAGRLRVAACYLLVVEALKGARAGAAAAGALYGAALAAGQYGLVGELTRFLVRPAAEAAAAEAAAAEAAAADAVRRGGAGGVLRWFVGAPPEPTAAEPSEELPVSFFFRPEPDVGEKSGTFPKDAPGTPRGARRVPGARGGAIPLLPAPLREALREHAAALASSRDLGNLSALSRETGFDVGCFLLDQSARVPGGGAARLGDFPKALDVAADSLARHRARGDPLESAAWAGVGAFLEQTRRAGPAGAEWTLVVATLLRSADALEEVFAGRSDLKTAWDRGVRACVLNAEARGDTRRAAFLDAFREDVCATRTREA